MKPAPLSETEAPTKHRQEEGESAAPSPVPGGGSPPASRPSGKHRRLFRYLLAGLGHRRGLGRGRGGSLRSSPSAKCQHREPLCHLESAEYGGPSGDSRHDGAVHPDPQGSAAEIGAALVWGHPTGTRGASSHPAQGDRRQPCTCGGAAPGTLEFYDLGTQFGTAYTSQAQALKAAGVTASRQLPKRRRSDPLAGLGGESDRLLVSRDHPTGHYRVGSRWGATGLRPVQQCHGRPTVHECRGHGLRRPHRQDGTEDSGHRRGPATGDRSRRDGRICSTVKEQVSGGQAEITSKPTVDEAKIVVLLLQTGVLPLDIASVT